MRINVHVVQSYNCYTGGGGQNINFMYEYACTLRSLPRIVRPKNYKQKVMAA